MKNSNQDEIYEYQEMWTFPDRWVLLRNQSNEASVEIKPAFEGLSIKEIAIIRRLIPEFSQTSVGETKLLLFNKKVYATKSMSLEEAKTLVMLLEKNNLTANLVQREVSYLPIQVSNKMATIIEDDQIAVSVIQKMINAGVLVTDNLIS